MGWIGYYTSLIILIKINSSDMCTDKLCGLIRVRSYVWCLAPFSIIFQLYRVSMRKRDINFWSSSLFDEKYEIQQIFYVKNQ